MSYSIITKKRMEQDTKFQFLHIVYFTNTGFLYLRSIN